MVKKLFVLMFLTILLVGTISAIIDYGIDNSKIIKKYDAQGFAKKIEVWDDNLFGTPTTKLTTIELKTPHVVNVGVGYQKVAEFQIVGNVTYDEVLSKIDLNSLAVPVPPSKILLLSFNLPIISIFIIAFICFLSTGE